MGSYSMRVFVCRAVSPLTGLFVSMAFLAVGVAILGSYLPSRTLLHKTINEVLRDV